MAGFKGKQPKPKLNVQWNHYISIVAFRVKGETSLNLLFLQVPLTNLSSWIDRADDLYDIMDLLFEASIGAVKLNKSPFNGLDCMHPTYDIAKIGVRPKYQRQGFGFIEIMTSLVIAKSDGAGITSDRRNATTIEAGRLFEKVLLHKIAKYKTSDKGWDSYDYKQERGDPSAYCLEPGRSGKYDLGGSIVMHPQWYKITFPLVQKAIARGAKLVEYLPLNDSEIGSLMLSLANDVFEASFQEEYSIQNLYFDYFFMQENASDVRIELFNIVK